jgi:5-(carboxyamino)imidazole ribonucleotide mutase
VATVGINGARNAGLLAVRMLALSDQRLMSAIDQRREAMAATVRTADAEISKRFSGHS